MLVKGAILNKHSLFIIIIIIEDKLLTNYNNIIDKFIKSYLVITVIGLHEGKTGMLQAIWLYIYSL